MEMGSAPFVSSSQPLNKVCTPTRSQTPLPTITEWAAYLDISVLRSNASCSAQPLALTYNQRAVLTSPYHNPNYPSTPNEAHVEDSDRYSLSLNAQFAAKFGPCADAIDENKILMARAPIIPPLLEQIYEGIKTSQLLRHMWSHAKKKEFATRGDLYDWVQRSWAVSVVHAASQINHMKTVRMKNCAPLVCGRKSNYSRSLQKRKLIPKMQ